MKRRIETIVITCEGERLPEWICESHLSNTDVHGVRVEAMSMGNAIREHEEFFIKVSDAWDRYKRGGKGRYDAEGDLDELLDSL